MSLRCSTVTRAVVLAIVLPTGPALALAPAEPAPAVAPSTEPTAASAGPSEEVTALLQRADAAFEEGRLLDAWDAIDEAEALQPGPFYEYMRGLIRQAQGRCDLAVQHWATYLPDAPESDAQAVRLLIEQCGGLPEPEPEPGLDPDPEPSAEPPPSEGPSAPSSGPPPSDGPRVRSRDVAGGVLLGTGIASLAASGGLWLGAGLSHRGAPQRESLMEHDAALRRASGLSIAAIATATVGVGLVVGAVVRYAQIRRRTSATAQHPLRARWARSSR